MAIVIVYIYIYIYSYIYIYITYFHYIYIYLFIYVCNVLPVRRPPSNPEHNKANPEDLEYPTSTLQGELKISTEVRGVWRTPRTT